MEHLRWERTGRIFRGDEPDQLIFKSSVGQCNVDLGDGDYAPYVWDAQKKIARFGLCELRFTASGLEFWHEQEKLNTLTFHPEYKQGANWERRLSPVVGELTTEEIDPINALKGAPKETDQHLSKAELKISYKISTEDSETEVFIRVGYNQKVHFGTHFKSLKDGIEQRVAVEFDEKFTPVEERDKEGNLLPTARLRTDKTWWAWDRGEQTDHEFEQAIGTRIYLGRKVYAQGEEKIISPDTWGTDIGIAANADDGDQDPDTGWNISGRSGNSIWMGDLSSFSMHGGFRWDGITIPQASTINSALIDIYANATDYNSAPSVNVSCWAHDDAPVFDDTNLPSAVTKTSSVAWNNIAVGNPPAWRTSPSLVTPVQEIISRSGFVSGNAIAFAFIENSAAGAYATFEDFNNAGTNEAELTITYTLGEPALDQKNFRFFAAGDELPHWDAATITRGDTVTTWSTSSTVTAVSFSHTVDANTTLLILAITMDADASITAEPQWNTNEAFTLIKASTSSNASGDQKLYIYGLVNPTATTANITYTMSSDDHGHATAVNYLNTISTSVADATNFINETVNNSASQTTVISSGGTSGATLFLAGSFHGGDGDPASNDATFAELADSATGTDTAADDAFYVADKIGGAPSAVTITWAVSDENCGVLIEILPLLTADGRTPLAIAGADVELEVDTDYGWQFRVENSGAATTEDTYKIQYKKNAGSWTDLTSSSSNIKASATADFVHGADVSEYITGSGTYVTDNNAALDTGGSLTLAAVLGSGQAFEGHLNFQIVGADVADEDTIQLRVVYEDGTELESYSDTPTITVNKAGGGKPYYAFAQQ